MKSQFKIVNAAENVEVPIKTHLIATQDATSKSLTRSIEVIELAAKMIQLASKRGSVSVEESEIQDAAA